MRSQDQPGIAEVAVAGRFPLPVQPVWVFLASPGASKGRGNLPTAVIVPSKVCLPVQLLLTALAGAGHDHLAQLQEQAGLPFLCQKT